MNSAVAEKSTQQRVFDQLRLIRSANVGPVSYIQRIRRFGSAGLALEAIPDLAQVGGGRVPKIADVSAIDAELQQILALNAEMLILGEKNYPTLERAAGFNLSWSIIAFG